MSEDECISHEVFMSEYADDDFWGDLGDKNSEINKDLKLLFGGEE